MIRSFRDEEAAGLFDREPSRRLPPEIQAAAYRKLKMLDAATSLQDLRVPWENRLEPLEGDREGHARWRICFRWEAGNAFDVEVVDYH